ncbi:amino acid ABC transporter permease, partial [Acinetobacter baumannii]
MAFSLLHNPDVIAALKEGVLFTLTVTVLAMMGGILIGTPLAMMRLSNNALASNFAKFYVDSFRGIPLI